LTGIFAEKKISTMAGGLEINGGWVEQNVNIIKFRFLNLFLTYFLKYLSPSGYSL